jgi:hypothetical protein
MNQVTLASNAGYGGFVSLWRWGVHHPVVALALAAGVAIYFVWAIKWGKRRSKRMSREPAPFKATLRGTAQVLSFKQFSGYGYGGRNCWCKFRLEVHIPGREPYVTVIQLVLDKAQRSAVRRGMTLQVRVDPHGDPKNVYIEALHQPYM